MLGLSKREKQPPKTVEEKAKEGMTAFDAILSERAELSETVRQQEILIAGLRATQAELHNHIAVLTDERDRIKLERDDARDKLVAINVQFGIIHREIQNAFNNAKREIEAKKIAAAKREVEAALNESIAVTGEPVVDDADEAVAIERLANRLAPKDNGHINAA